MTIEIKELVSNGSTLIDLTDAESSEVNGGYASYVTVRTNADKGAKAYGIVLNQSAYNPGVAGRQLLAGIPPTVIAAGTVYAISQGGTYTPAVAFAKLEG